MLLLFSDYPLSTIHYPLLTSHYSHTFALLGFPQVYTKVIA